VEDREIDESLATTGVERARGALFDLDGVLVSTEELKALAHTETVAGYGGRLDPWQYRAEMGRAYDDVIDAFIRRTGIDADPADYSKAFRSAYLDLLRARLQLTPGAADLLQALNEQGYRLAVVSSSLRWMMDEILGRTRLDLFFHTVVSAEDVREEKPSPEPYELALKRLALEPRNAVVFEDTQSGVTSGSRAGVKVIAVRHEYNVDHDLSRAAMVLDSLADTPRTLRGIRQLLDDNRGCG
jgi:HAD superfamily hydrolase (TIGR01509 family)